MAKIQKQGGKSKKARQHMTNEQNGRYKRQARRTNARKIKTLEAYLKNNPNDIQNKADIKTALKFYNVA